VGANETITYFMVGPAELIEMLFDDNDGEEGETPSPFIITHACMHAMGSTRA